MKNIKNCKNGFHKHPDLNGAKYADLHVHTNKSDSTFTPEEVVEYAYRCGLSAIAITDHDSVEAVSSVKEAAKKYNMEIIPGVELSADIDEEEIHILGYYINCEKKWFLNKLLFLRKQRLNRAKEIVEKLKKCGINISLDSILYLSGEGAVGRIHIAKILLDKGYVRSIPEAFNKYIGRGKEAYVKKYRLTPEESIAMIKRLGGLAVLAHPDITGQDKFIEQMVSDGLGGIEVYHSDHNKKSEKHYLELAKRHNLLVTGGSDCHGMGKTKALLGAVKVPYEIVEKLKKKICDVSNNTQE